MIWKIFFLSTYIYVKDVINEKKKRCFLQQEKNTGIPVGGGASIFLSTGTGTFSLGTTFLRTSGTLEK